MVSIPLLLTRTSSIFLNVEKEEPTSKFKSFRNKRVDFPFFAVAVETTRIEFVLPYHSLPLLLNPMRVSILSTFLDLFKTESTSSTNIKSKTLSDIKLKFFVRNCVVVKSML